MAKSYSPVKIVDPIGSPIIVLHPNQEFVITLNSSFGVVDVDIHSHFLEIDSSAIVSSSRTYLFKQTQDFSRWAKYSKVYLGNVIIITKSDIITICVFLDTFNKSASKQITAINPEGHEIKLEKDNLLEVVVYDKNLGDCDYWKASIVPGDFGVLLKQVHYDVITPPDKTSSEEFADFCEKMINVDDKYCAYPRSDLCREHHFWFQYDEESVIMMSNMENGVCDGGKLVFDGIAGDDKSRNLFNILNIRLNVKKRGIESELCVIPNRKSSSLSHSLGCLYKSEIILKEKQECSLDSESRILYYKTNE